MRKCFICMLSFMMVCVSHAEDITIRYMGSTAKVTQKVKDSVNVTLEGAKVKAQSQGNDAVDANPAGGFFPPSFTGGDGGGSPATITIPFSMRQSATLVANASSISSKGGVKHPLDEVNCCDSSPSPWERGGERLVSCLLQSGFFCATKIRQCKRIAKLNSFPFFFRRAV